MKPKTARKVSATQSKTTSKRAKPHVAKKVSTPSRKTEEQALHMNCVQWFRKTYPDVLAFHVPNGEKRDRRTAEKLKRMGVLPGVYDWLVFPVLRNNAIVEFKRTDGVLSTDQERFSRMWQLTGGDVYEARTLEEFQAACRAIIGHDGVVDMPPEPELPREHFPWEKPSGDSNPSAADVGV